MKRLFEGIKTGNKVVIPIRKGHRNLKNKTLSFVQDGLIDICVCTKVLKRSNDDELTLVSYYSKGFKSDDGQVVMFVVSES